MTSQILAATASVALIGANLAGVGTRSIDAMPSIQSAIADGDGGSDNRCRVDVVRSGTAGVATVTRQDLAGGQCVCIVTTGPAGSNGSAEDVVTNLLRDRTCGDAPPAPATVTEAASGGRGGNGTLIITVLRVVGIAGFAVSLGKDSHG